MKRVFHGPLPVPEQQRVTAFFAAHGLGASDALGRADFLTSVEALQAAAEATPLDTTRSAHYQSFKQLRDHKLRQVRPDLAPNAVFAQPLTLLTEVGWRAHEPSLGYERHPKVQCEETKFMGELFKAGVI